MYRFMPEDEAVARRDTEVERRVIEFMSRDEFVGKRIKIWKVVNELSAEEIKWLRSLPRLGVGDLDYRFSYDRSNIRTRFMRVIWSLKRRGIISVKSHTSRLKSCRGGRRKSYWSVRLVEGWNS